MACLPFDLLKHHFVQTPPSKMLCVEHSLSLRLPGSLKSRKLCYAERAACVLVCASAMQAKTDLVEREKGAEARSPAGSVSKDLEAIHTRE